MRLTALRTGELVRIDDLAGEQRWGEYAVRALAHGVRSSLPMPLAVQERPVGALNLYSDRPHFFGEAQTRLGQRRRPRPPSENCRQNLIDSENWFRLGKVATTSDFERMLRAAALRVTRPRVAVLSAVHDHPHADTGPIIAAVRADLGEVSTRPSTTCCAR